MTKENLTMKFLASEQGTQLIQALKSISESFKALDNFFQEATPELFEESTKKRKRAIKDPNAPKAPMSSYFVFAQEHRQRVKEENPEMAPTEIVSELGRIWRTMSEEEKKSYVDTASELRDKYQHENAEYKKQKHEVGIDAQEDDKEEYDELPEGADTADENEQRESSSSEEEEDSEEEGPAAPFVVPTIVKKVKSSNKHAPVVVQQDSGSSSEEEKEDKAPKSVTIVPIKKKKKKAVAVAAPPKVKKSSGNNIPKTAHATSVIKKKNALGMTSQHATTGSSSKKMKTN